MATPPDRPEAAPSPVFVTTRWSLILAAGRGSEDALERLCTAYWYPTYHFIRRQGHSVHDAQDFTQEFFARLLDKGWVAQADQTRGRFRSFLLLMVKRFLAGEWRHAHAQKRAPGRQALPLDEAETRFQQETPGTGTAEEAFDRQWALTLLERSLRELRTEYERDGRVRIFDTLKPSLTGSRELQPYSDLAGALGLTEGAVKVAVHRLRDRYRKKLRMEISQTVTSPADVDDEMRHLIRVLARS